MRFQRPFRWLLLLTVGLTLSANHEPAKLTFEERVRAQGAIERFYFERRTGSDQTFEEAVPRSVLERKVEDTLSLSLLLEQRWGIDVTAQALREEAERMSRATRDPLRLRELFDALGNDPVLVQECLARQRLVQRWAREQFESESDSKAAWDEWWAGVRPEVDRAAIVAVQGLDDRPIAPAVVPLGVTDLDYEWVPSQLETGPTSNVVVWTGAEMLMWGGALDYQPSDLGRIYDPVTDSMTAMATTNAPSPRWGHSAIWTGTEMIVWGGNEATDGDEVALSSGDRYNPATGSWQPLSSAGAPSPRWGHSAIWTGTEMIVFGGSYRDYYGSYDIQCSYDATMNSGAEYDPASDSWVALPLEGAPAVRAKHTAIWTGDEMIVWGGAHGNPVLPIPGGSGFYCNDDDLRRDGAIYDPVLRRWTLVELPGSQPRYGHRAVWTGLEMLVYGLRPDSHSQPDPTGFRYDPSTGSSSAMSPLGQPTPGATVWNGGEMIVFRGAWGPNQSTGPGARYDPESDTWTDLPLANMPPGRQNYGAVWTGSSMLISGGRYLTSDDGGYLRATGTDGDGDGILDGLDNCPLIANPSQGDLDSDGIGDPCDPWPHDPYNDVDGDGLPRWSDNCPKVANAGQEDVDADGVGDVCDNCPADPNVDQSDREDDGVGNACDNCPHLFNPDQQDVDGDGIGDLCDGCAFDTCVSCQIDGRWTIVSDSPGDGSSVSNYEVTSGTDVPVIVYETGAGIWANRLFGVHSPHSLVNAPPEVWEFRLTPDERLVVYFADDGAGVDLLYRVSIDGGPVTRIATEEQPPFRPDFQIFEWELSTDSRGVVYRTTGPCQPDLLYESSLVTDEWDAIVSDYCWEPPRWSMGPWALTPDRRTAVFNWQDDQAGGEILARDVAPGGFSEHVFPQTGWLGLSNEMRFKIDPTSRYVLYEYGIGPPSVPAPEWRLYSHRLGVGGSVMILGGEEPYEFPTIQFTPDGSRITYRAAGELRSARVDATGGTPLITGFDLDRSNQLVAAQAMLAGDTHLALYVVPIGGGAPTRVSPLPQFADIADAGFTAQGDRLLFLGTFEPSGRTDLYTVVPPAGTPTRIVPTDSAASVDQFFIADDATVLFTVDGMTALERAPLAGGTATRVSASDHDLISDPRMVAGGDTIIYLARIGLETTEVVAYHDGPELDADGIPNLCDNCAFDDNLSQLDSDADGAGDVCDNCPWTPNLGQHDEDGDGLGDACDACPFGIDPDSDGICTAADNCPDLYNPDQADSDGDGAGDVCDTCPFDATDDFDSDGLCAGQDNCPVIANADQADTEPAGPDGVGDDCDNCPLDVNPSQSDVDLDGLGDTCDACPVDPFNDADADGHCAGQDNCPAVFNSDQADLDGDGQGNVCDNCLSVSNPGQLNSDGDPLGDVCDNCPGVHNEDQSDTDLDGIGDSCDNCLLDANPSQTDSDLDGLGDSCDPCPTDAGDDRDGDGVCFAVDNCTDVSNPDQSDSDGDGAGDACDNCLDVTNPDQLNSDGDSLGNACDNCPLVRNDSQADSDLELIAQWATSATASSEWSPTDWAAAQAVGPPEDSGCGSAPTNWSPLGGGVEPEWLELTYAIPVAATGVRLSLADGAGFITHVELRDVGGGLHTVWSGVDTNICGGEFYRTWDRTPYLVDGVIVHTAYDGWEEIDAVELIGAGGPSPDQIGDACDVCPSITEAPSDLDGDGVFDACDCDPYDSSARLPRDVGTILVNPTAERAALIIWPYNGFVDAYSVARVLLSELGPGEYGQCIASGISGSSYTEGDMPPAGDGFGYLVRGVDSACGPGTLGADSSGRLREDPDVEACP